MTRYRVQQAAGQRLDALYRYSVKRCGEDQASAYIRQLFRYFQQVALREVPRRPIPPIFGIAGFYGRCGRHFVYWKVLPDGAVGIVTVLHERMHQLDQFRDDHL